MRIPIAILMLCLPVAAMGEVFVCISEIQSVIDDAGEAKIINSGENSLTDIVVDAASGFRSLQIFEDDYRGSDYRGSCSKVGNFVIHCSYDDSIVSEQLRITLTDGTFTKSQHHQNFMISTLGSCTEI